MEKSIGRGAPLRLLDAEVWEVLVGLRSGCCSMSSDRSAYGNGWEIPLLTGEKKSLCLLFLMNSLFALFYSQSGLLSKVRFLCYSL